MSNDLLDLDYINSLPQPFIGITLRGMRWTIHDIEVETGLVRIDVHGMLDFLTISDFRGFIDANGIEHSSDSFFVDATADEREGHP